MCGSKKTCAFASLKMCGLLLVIGATHGLIEGIKKIRKLSCYAPVNLMRLVPDCTVAAFVVRLCVLAK